MVDPVTTNRGFAQPTRGSDTGTWDSPMNGNTTLLDTILGGVVSISSTGGTTTLNSTQLASGTISVSGIMASNIVLLFPAIQGWWTIRNAASNNLNFAVLVGSGTGATLIGIAGGQTADIQINGNTPSYRNFPPVGTYLDIAASAVPKWISSSTVPPYLNCDGSAFNTVTYPYLAEFLPGGTVPDARGRARFATNQGTSRVTSGGSGVDGNTVTASGGNELAQQHSHSTNVSDPGHSHTTNIGGTQIWTSAGGANIGGSPNTAFQPSGLSINPAATGINVSINNSLSGGSQNMPPAFISGLTLIRAG